jgi:hypothetical protein
VRDGGRQAGRVACAVYMYTQLYVLKFSRFHSSKAFLVIALSRFHTQDENEKNEWSRWMDGWIDGHTHIFILKFARNDPHAECECVCAHKNLRPSVFSHFTHIF